MVHYKFNNDCQSSVLTYDQVKRLDSVINQVVTIHGRGNFPTLHVRLKELIRLIKHKLQSEHSIEIRDIRLNGGCASYVLAPENSHYNDLDLIFATDLSNEERFDVIRDVVLECLHEFMPKVSTVDEQQSQQQQQQQQQQSTSNDNSASHKTLQHNDHHHHHQPNTHTIDQNQKSQQATSVACQNCSQLHQTNESHDNDMTNTKKQTCDDTKLRGHDDDKQQQQRTALQPHDATPTSGAKATAQRSSALSDGTPDADIACPTGEHKSDTFNLSLYNQDEQQHGYKDKSIISSGKDVRHQFNDEKQQTKKTGVVSAAKSLLQQSTTTTTATTTGIIRALEVASLCQNVKTKSNSESRPRACCTGNKSENVAAISGSVQQQQQQQQQQQVQCNILPAGQPTTCQIIKQKQQMPLNRCAIKEAYVHKMVKVNDDDRWSLISLGVQQSEANCCAQQLADLNNQQYQSSTSPGQSRRGDQQRNQHNTNKSTTFQPPIQQHQSVFYYNNPLNQQTQNETSHQYNHHQQHHQHNHYQQNAPQKQFPNSIDLKFVDKMRRKFEFSVDSFQIILDSLIKFYDYAPQTVDCLQQCGNDVRDQNTAQSSCALVGGQPMCTAHDCHGMRQAASSESKQKTSVCTVDNENEEAKVHKVKVNDISRVKSVKYSLQQQQHASCNRSEITSVEQRTSKAATARTDEQQQLETNAVHCGNRSTSPESLFDDNADQKASSECAQRQFNGACDDYDEVDVNDEFADIDDNDRTIQAAHANNSDNSFYVDLARVTNEQANGAGVILSSVPSSSGCSSSSSVVSSSSSSLSCDEDHEDSCCDTDIVPSSSESTSSLLNSTISSLSSSSAASSSVKNQAHKMIGQARAAKSCECADCFKMHKILREHHMQSSQNSYRSNHHYNHTHHLQHLQQYHQQQHHLQQQKQKQEQKQRQNQQQQREPNSVNDAAPGNECLCEFTGNAVSTVLQPPTRIGRGTRAVISKNFYPTVIGRSEYGSFKEALYHLERKLIATRSPEEIRGGGLLKYCNLLVRNYEPVNANQIRTLERYMCSRFFIDFSDPNQQQAKLESYLANHFSDDPMMKFDYLTILHNVVQRSTVCLMNHELRLTLNMISGLAYKINKQQQELFRYNHQQQQQQQQQQQIKRARQTSNNTDQLQLQQKQQNQTNLQQQAVEQQSPGTSVKLAEHERSLNAQNQPAPVNYLPSNHQQQKARQLATINSQNISNSALSLAPVSEVKTSVQQHQPAQHFQQHKPVVLQSGAYRVKLVNYTLANPMRP